jgi:pimeloyl-ACP methyl ester carboxylesterase/class 3 adenylate cyclase
MGSGPVLIVPPGGTTHLEWYIGDTEAQRRFCARLAEHHTLVLYDRHGCGLSDRNRTNFTPEDDMADLEAVIEALGVDDVAFFGISDGGNPTLAYAAQHPERVRAIVLYGTYPDGRWPPELEAREEALMALRRADFEAYLRTAAARFFPSGTDPETFRSLVRHLRDSTTMEMGEKLRGVRFDNQSLLSTINVPALVLHRRGDMQCPFAAGQYLARKLPNARFIPLEGDAHYPWVDDAESVLRPTIEFLTGEKLPALTNRAASPGASGTAIILFADIVDSTAITERIGDTAFHAKSEGLHRALREALASARGRVVEGRVLGDGVMAVFEAAKDAIAAAAACHEAAARASADAPEGTSLLLHVGIHAGDVIRDEKDVHGGAVNLAARVAAASGAGETLVSDVVRALGRTSAGVAFEDRGEFALKGIEEPQRLFAVRQQS